MLLAAAADADISWVTVGLTAGSIAFGWLLKALTDWVSQRRLFEHRLRVEKEYELYSDVWDKLFEMQRAVGQIVQPFGSTANVQHNEDVIQAFNAYQSSVRKSEPFMKSSIYKPARKIVELAGEIIGNVRSQKRIEEQRTDHISISQDQELADKQIELDNDSDAKFEEIKHLFEQVAQRIRQRVSP